MRKLVLALLSILLLKLCLSKVSAAITCIEKEREALLQLKKSFYDPSHRLASWNHNNASDCCNWDRVACNQTTGHVIKIDLRNNFQVYSFPFDTTLYSNSLDSSLLEFKYLNYLDLSLNHFNNSQIPNFLGSMLELRYLNLSEASFYGKVPPHLGNLTKLVVLDLSFYHFYDARWPELNDTDIEWISHLSSLQFLDLSGMNFSSASNMMRMLTSLPFLSSLRLSSCRLQNIHLSWSSLNSSFLSRIQLLDLSHNNFNGPIPKAFQNMTSLRSLYLSYNEFSTIEGGILSFIGNHCGLKVLDLSFNPYLGGSMFGSYGNESMGCNRYDLQVLDLTLTFVKEKILDWLGKLKNLRSLSLLYNGIYGPIPASLGNLSSLEHLDLSHNALTGAIPTSLGRLLNLKKLNLESNGLNKLGEECFIQLGNLEVLDISSNLLKGVLTEASFSNLSQLHVFYFGTNDHLLFDMKPNWVPPFQLNILDGRSCIGCFGSEFPQWLRTQKALVGLQLSNMSISSALPTWLRGQKLTTLDLSYNQIVGPLPTTIGDQMPNLSLLDLSNNQIVGPLPTSIGNQMPNLETLFLDNNLINDSLLQSLCKVKNLAYLDLSHNQIMGPFPTSIGNQMPNLKSLSLKNNLISDSLPLWLCKVKNLAYLDLSSNSLSGMVQGCLLTSNLMILDLSLNEFSGTIPYSHENGFSNVLEQLHLRNNNFEGSMPIVLKNSINLKILDLEGNKFSGNIPTWVGDNLRHLRFLRLRGNLFNGTIPASLCNLTYLQILDLADNQLEGSIPSNLNNFNVMTGKEKPIWLFNNFILPLALRSATQIFFEQSIKSNYFNYSVLQLTFMVNIDLSKNYLVGFIPSEITMLKALIGLNLSHNNLTGTIPTNIRGIKSLESLDLSFNQLSGPIPRSISELNSLGVLKLSHNNLSGDIPREGHSSTFNEASSFDGNPYLCGDPLPVKCAMENPFEPSFEMEKLDQEEDKWEKWLLYIVITLGYAVGFWATVGTLILKRSWRYAYFKFVDETKYKVQATMWRSIEMLKGLCTRK